jgi:predicted GNAT family acetyltransferase
MADISSLVKALKDKAVAQYEKGAPYRQALASALQGNIQGVNQALSQSDLTPMDFAMTFAPMGILENAQLTKKIGEGINEYKKDFGNTKIEYHHYKPENMIDITKIYTPPELRGKGSARDAMNQLLLETDKLGTTTQLVPTPMDKITNPEKLKQFYKSLGYEELPYSFNQEAGSMIRYPIER